MKKTVFLGFILIVAIVISCQWAQKKETEREEITMKGAELAQPPSTLISAKEGYVDKGSPNRDHSAESFPSRSLKGGVSFPSPLSKSQFDSKELDRRVIEMAHLVNKDKKTFRLLLREDPSGIKIYRSLGMHIIVNPEKEEIYLPDEL